MTSPIKIEYQGRLAIITIDNPKKLNALDQSGYYDLARALHEVATHDEVYITLLIGRGRFFSAGADVTVSRLSPSPTQPPSQDVKSTHHHYLHTFASNNLHTTHAFSSHPKILIAALNGPVVGLSAALIAHADFIYAVPSTFLLTPFSSLGLVAEGGASRALVQRLGIAKANEALIMSRKIECADLERVGFVNKVFEECDDMGKEGEDEKFKGLVLREIEERLGSHLVGESLLGIKKLIRKPERDVVDVQTVAETMAGLERFVSGVPQGEFEKIATGKKRHKL